MLVSSVETLVNIWPPMACRYGGCCGRLVLELMGLLTSLFHHVRGDE